MACAVHAAVCVQKPMSLLAYTSARAALVTVFHRTKSATASLYVCALFRIHSALRIHSVLRSISFPAATHGQETPWNQGRLYSRQKEDLVKQCIRTGGRIHMLHKYSTKTSHAGTT
jgi:hypothetical protein